MARGSVGNITTVILCKKLDLEACVGAKTSATKIVDWPTTAANRELACQERKVSATN
jgi:hypothetical protein